MIFKELKTNLKAKQLKNGKIKLSMNSFEVSKEFCDELGITIQEYKKRKGAVVKESTEKILLAFVKSQTDFNKNQEAFNKNIMNEVKQIKARVEEMANTPTMRRELSKS